MVENKLALIGYASGLAGVSENCAQGPLVMQRSPYLSIPAQWEMIYPAAKTNQRLAQVVGNLATELAKKISLLTKAKKNFAVVGGDHTSAVGTWSGVYDALHTQGEIGLIWFDAHMDSHTPETTQTGRLHGMPLASLLGYGYPELTSVLDFHAKIKPENICLIGVRSFERSEEELLKKLNVRIYFMDEIKKRGFDVIWKEAIQLVSKNTVGYGLSIDLDGLDPKDIPAVDVPEPNGISAQEFYDSLAQTIDDPKLVGVEFIEFDPALDKNHLTEKWLAKFLEVVGEKS